MRWAVDVPRNRGAAYGGGQRAAGGFTLFEIGLVVGLLGIIALLIAEFYVTQQSLRFRVQRVDGAVRDAQSVIDAALAWSEGEGQWPADRNGEIDIDELERDGFLNPVPLPRYVECPESCGYSLIGWDRDAPQLDGSTGDYTIDVTRADDLILRFGVPGDDAITIAGQLPLGRAIAPTTEGAPYRVEARVSRGFGRYVLLANEARVVRFASNDGGDPGGRLENIDTLQAQVVEVGDRIEVGGFQLDADCLDNLFNPSPDPAQTRQSCLGGTSGTESGSD